MMYDSYVKKVEHYKEIKDKIMKYKFLIIGAFALFIAIITFFLVATGQFTSGLSLSSDTIAYGDDFTCSASAMLSNVYYEYREEGSDEWTTEKPINAGSYYVRAVTNATGGHKYSEEKKITILPREITLTLKETTIEYSKYPVVSAENLLSQDHLDGAIFSFKDRSLTITEATLTSIKVMRGTKDVSKSYVFNTITDTITFTKHSISISLGSYSKVYDGEEFQYPNEINGIDLGYDDTISYDLSYSKNNVQYQTIRDCGTYKVNLNNISITNNGNSTMNNYTISSSNSMVTIEKRPIVIYTDSLGKMYDGTPLECVSYGVSKKSKYDLVSKHHLVNESSSVSLVNYGTRKNNLNIRIYDENNVDVTDTLYDVTYEYGDLSISKRPITVLTGSDTFTYDGSYHSVSTLSISPNSPYPLVSSDTLVAYNVRSEKNASEYENKLEAKTSSGSDNYSISYEYGTLRILPRSLTLEPLDVSDMVYTGLEYSYPTKVSNYTITSGSLVGSDSLRITVSIKNTNNDAPIHVGKYTITGIDYQMSNGLKSNYSVQFVNPKSFNITKASLLLEAKDMASVTYNGQSYSYNAGYTATTQTSDSIRVSVTAKFVNSSGKAVANPKDADTYRIYISSYDGSLDKDYNVSYSTNPKTFIINPQHVTIMPSCDGESKVYTAKEMVYTKDKYKIVSGQFYGTDSISVKTYTNTTPINVDSYTVYLSESSFTGTRGNYEITLQTGTITVTKLTITIRPTTEASQVYNGVMHTYVGGYEYVGNSKFLNGEQITVSVNYCKEGSSTYDGALHAATYVSRIWSYSGNITELKNYNILKEDNTFIITPISITIKPGCDGESFEYSGYQPAYTKDTFIYKAGSDCMIGTDMLYVTTKMNANSYHVGEYEVEISKYDFSSLYIQNDYIVTLETSHISITARNVTVRAIDMSSTYEDEIKTDYECVIGSFVEANVISPTYTFYNGSNICDVSDLAVGTYSYALTGIKFTGSNKEDYSITLDKTKAKYTISKRKIVISLTKDATKIYDGNTFVYNSNDISITDANGARKDLISYFTPVVQYVKAGEEKQPLHAGTYSIYLIGYLTDSKTEGLYDVSLNASPRSLVIQKKTITIVPKDITLDYLGKEQQITSLEWSYQKDSIDGIDENDTEKLWIFPDNNRFTNAGEYRGSCSYFILDASIEKDDYTIKIQNVNINILPVKLFINVLADTIVTYTGLEQTYDSSNVEVIGLLEEEALRPTLSYTFDFDGSTPVHVGRYEITGVSLYAVGDQVSDKGFVDNYDINVELGGYLEITPLDLNVKLKDQTIYYGDEIDTEYEVIKHLSNGLNVYVNATNMYIKESVTKPYPVGTYTLSADLGNVNVWDNKKGTNSDYSISITDSTLKVIPREIILQLEENETYREFDKKETSIDNFFISAYDKANNKIDGFVLKDISFKNNETEEVVSRAINAGVYTVSIIDYTSPLLENFTIVEMQTIEYQIITHTVTVSIQNIVKDYTAKTVVYDDGDFITTIHSSIWDSDDSITINPNRIMYSGSNLYNSMPLCAGNYTIGISQSSYTYSGPNKDNYTFEFNTPTLEIMPLLVHVYYTDYSFTYDSLYHTFDTNYVTLNGLAEAEPTISFEADAKFYTQDYSEGFLMIRYAGTYIASIDNIKSSDNLTIYQKCFTTNYKFIYETEYALVTIRKAELSLTVLKYEKDYDGKEVKFEDLKIIATDGTYLRGDDSISDLGSSCAYYNEYMEPSSMIKPGIYSIEIDFFLDKSYSLRGSYDITLSGESECVIINKILHTVYLESLDMYYQGIIFDALNYTWIGSTYDGEFTYSGIYVTYMDTETNLMVENPVDVGKYKVTQVGEVLFEENEYYSFVFDNTVEAYLTINPISIYECFKESNVKHLTYDFEAHSIDTDEVFDLYAYDFLKNDVSYASSSIYRELTAEYVDYVKDFGTYRIISNVDSFIFEDGKEKNYILSDNPIIQIIYVDKLQIGIYVQYHNYKKDYDGMPLIIDSLEKDVLYKTEASGNYYKMSTLPVSYEMCYYNTTTNVESASMIEAGDYTYYPKNFKSTDSDFDIRNLNFNLERSGSATIEPLSLVLNLEDLVLSYDGMEKYFDFDHIEYEILSGSILPGDEIAIYADHYYNYTAKKGTKTIVDSGIYGIAEDGTWYLKLRRNGEVIGDSFNYAILVENDPRIQITSPHLSIKVKNQEKLYDGEAFTFPSTSGLWSDRYEVIDGYHSELNYLLFDVYYKDEYGTIVKNPTEVGTYEILIDESTIREHQHYWYPDDNVYTIDLIESGYLSITMADLNVSLENGYHIYDSTSNYITPVMAECLDLSSDYTLELFYDYYDILNDKWYYASLNELPVHAGTYLVSYANIYNLYRNGKKITTISGFEIHILTSDTTLTIEQREARITALNQKNTYNGMNQYQESTFESYYKISGFINGEKPSVSFQIQKDGYETTTLVDAASYKVILTYNGLIYPEDNPLNSDPLDYKITVEAGSYTITPISLNILPNIEGEKDYDATEILLGNTDYMIQSGVLLEGDKLTVSFSYQNLGWSYLDDPSTIYGANLASSIKNAGNYRISVSEIMVLDAFGNDITMNYSFNEDIYQTFTVHPLDISISTGSMSFIFDNVSHIYTENFQITGATALPTHVAVWDEGRPQEALFPGEYENVLGYAIYDSETLENVTTNYKVEKENRIYGTITILKRKVTIKTAGNEDYDGRLVKDEFNNIYYGGYSNPLYDKKNYVITDTTNDGMNIKLFGLNITVSDYTIVRTVEEGMKENILDFKVTCKDYTKGLEELCDITYEAGILQLSKTSLEFSMKYLDAKYTGSVYTITSDANLTFKKSSTSYVLSKYGEKLLKDNLVVYKYMGDLENPVFDLSNPDWVLYEDEIKYHGIYAVYLEELHILSNNRELLDVTSSYDIDYGPYFYVFKISQVEITLATGSYSEGFISRDQKISYPYINYSESMLDNHSIVIDEATITYATPIAEKNNVENKFDFIIVDSNGINVTDEFIITMEYGILSIDTEFILSTYMTKIYDGTDDLSNVNELSTITNMNGKRIYNLSFTYIKNSIYYDSSLENICLSPIHAGTYYYSLKEDSVILFDSNGNDISDLVTSGDLVLHFAVSTYSIATKRLFVQNMPASFTYDGEYHYYEDYFTEDNYLLSDHFLVNSQELASGHRIQIVTNYSYGTDSQEHMYYLKQTRNYITKVIIYDSNDQIIYIGETVNNVSSFENINDEAIGFGNDYYIFYDYYSMYSFNSTYCTENNLKVNNPMFWEYFSIKAREIHIETYGMNWLYDGNEHYYSTADAYKFVDPSGDLVGDGEFEDYFEVIEKSCVVGVRSVELQNCLKFNFYNSQGKKITGSYSIRYDNYETISVTKRKIGVQVGSKTKVYDGQALTYESLDILEDYGDGLLSNHVLDLSNVTYLVVDERGKETEVIFAGEKAYNTVNAKNILVKTNDEKAKYVTLFYEIEVFDGVLEVVASYS